MATPARPDAIAVLEERALRDAFASVVGDAEVFTRRAAILLADMFGVGPMSMVLRLERMGLVREGTLDWFRSNGGITVDHIDRVRRETAAAIVRRGE
ncbi:hypothetical protein [Pinisolibacter sp.]|uniref:hypothetical protein n=1 Tax=Pinisolibacter sp. TaxID=2172024 RepID=UPI002FDD920E